ncbi:2-oxo acid dehydrogenase subunit E2 [Aestuariicella hydrocarbonica]|uniref:Dihydrolipoamide acetyltransferase component of pyruvate dehydrogenase complex n=1 Tax=Pseudomaricurvus hydrocarbonicus TaxID=1470433 RepID=A0A9E5JU13_9GAMM|nr:2-oxo acid dehydrogenase subunit E2 [Aestuariicella hydrocarbonica]NHO66828.1 2-oxo acid dehydrogenase subunit E2 [Aestuariicella hydrocarbonica]
MSVITAINMPKWGMEMSEGVISVWHLNIGDPVIEGADLLDVETSKIINTITASHAGNLRAITANPGDTLNVGALLGVIASNDVSEEDIQVFIASRSNDTSNHATESAAQELAPVARQDAEAKPLAPSSPTLTAASTPTTSLGSLALGEDDSSVGATVVARRLAKDYGVNLNNLNGTGRHNRVTKADLEQAVLAAGGQLIGQSDSAERPRPAADDSQVKATAVARRLAKDLKVNLLDCRASGDRGRVCKADVEAQAARQQTPVPSTTGQSHIEPPAELQTEIIAMSGMRKTIARRLQESKQTAPHFRVNTDVCIDNLLATRKLINASNRQAKVSVNDFIVKACASALQKIPSMNIQFDGENITRFQHADISVAVAIDEGLITPIVKASETKGLVALSNEIRDLATRAKIGRLSAEEFQGGTFCVSNLGMFGVKSFDAIINPPQAAILAVGTGEPCAVVRNGELTVATMMSLSLSSDHRVIDGALAAEFMSCLKGLLEQPATILG